MTVFSQNDRFTRLKAAREHFCHESTELCSFSGKWLIFRKMSDFSSKMAKLAILFRVLDYGFGRMFILPIASVQQKVSDSIAQNGRELLKMDEN